MAQKSLEAQSPGWAPPTLSSEDALPPVTCDEKHSEDMVLNHIGFLLVKLVIFQENQSLGVLRVWVQVTQIWLRWPVTSTIQRAPLSEGTPPLLSLS